MQTKRRLRPHRLAFAVIALIAALAFDCLCGMNLDSCGPPPVDPGVTCYIRGKLVGPDGNPLGDHPVYIYKDWSRIGLWSTPETNDVTEHLPHLWMETTAGYDGRLGLKLTSEDVNTESGTSAAYFALAVFDYSGERPLVVSNDYVFSNEETVWNLGEIRLWDDFSVTVNPDDASMDFSWLPPANEMALDYALFVDEGEWMEWPVPEAKYLRGLSAAVLDPDRGNHTFRMLGWSQELRYETSYKWFPNFNPYEPIREITAKTPDEVTLPPLTDGNYDTKSKIPAPGEAIILELPCPHKLTGLSIHDLEIQGSSKVTIDIFVSSEGKPLTLWRTYNRSLGLHGRLFHYFLDSTGQECSRLILQISEPLGAAMDSIKEIALFGQPL
jgi:hypothetical protein